jgi:hypothetical protein
MLGGSGKHREHILWLGLDAHCVPSLHLPLTPPLVFLTAGGSLLAAPFVAQSLLADSPGGSFTALLVGFALVAKCRCLP